MTPSTLCQLAILIAFVLPGTVYQAVRARLAGEAPANRDLSNKVLRALAVSAVFDGLYGTILGPTIVSLLRTTRTRDTGLGRMYEKPASLGSLCSLRSRLPSPSLPHGDTRLARTSLDSAIAGCSRPGGGSREHVCGSAPTTLSFG
jgi:hypothetical protein